MESIESSVVEIPRFRAIIDRPRDLEFSFSPVSISIRNGAAENIGILQFRRQCFVGVASIFLLFFFF